MERFMPEPITKTYLAIHGALAIFGAVVHAAQAHRNGSSKTLLDFIVLVLMSSFSGVMFSLIGLQFFGDQIYVSMALAGTGGFVGVEGMTLIVEKLRSLLIKVK